MVATPFEERQTPRQYHPRPWSTSASPGGSAPSRCRRASSSPRWRASACRRFAARDAATARGSSARRWSAARASSTATRRPSATCASPSDEHPLAIQLFGSDPRPMADAARMVEAVGGGHRRRQLRLPREEGDEDGRGRAPARGSRTSPAGIVEAIAEAVDVPVTVKLRRGVRNGSRACLELGPRLVEAGAASLTLHPRSAQQMYTGTADHALTAELVSLVDVPVVASGDVTSRARAQAVLAYDRRRGGHGRPRRAGEPVGAPRDRRRRRLRSRRARRSRPSSCSSSARPCASSGSGAPRGS